GLAVGDVNGDGRVDIVQTGVSVLYNRGTPTATAATERRMSTSAGAPKLRWWLGVGGRAASQPSRSNAR
ncbi:MAG TPA: VCBS repeat-containing protein, partial [Rhizobacter sp.]